MKSLSRPLHEPAARRAQRARCSGLALGVTFTVCFVTGLYSHFAQHPPAWFLLPARPAGLYRVTQGLHVATGIASIPLLFAKFWTVYPKLFSGRRSRSFATRSSASRSFPLIAGALFLLFTGLANINLWYPWKFNFPIAHYWAAWTTIGALIVHIGAKWAITRRRRSSGERAASPRRPRADDSNAGSSSATVFGTERARHAVHGRPDRASPLRKLALLAPRRPDTGPQGFPVNRTARAAGCRIGRAVARLPAGRVGAGPRHRSA